MTKNGLTDPSMPPGVQETVHGSQQDSRALARAGEGSPRSKVKGRGPERPAEWVESDGTCPGASC